jgi:tetratricopeptide (TPR) repeat protein
MKNFLKSIFVSDTLSPEEEKQKEENKKFEVFKYDGIRAQNMGQLALAIKFLGEARAMRKDEEVLSHLGQALTVTGKLAEAYEVYNELVALKSDVLSYFLSLANVCFLLDKYDEMLNATVQAIALDGENAAAHFMQGRAHKGLKDNVMAVADLTKAISLQDNFVDALLLRADILITMEQYEDAEKDVDLVLQQNDADEDALRLKGKLFEAQKKYDEAESVYRNLIAADPFNEQAYLNLGQLLITQNKLTDAISLFNDAIELNPSFADAYKERGRAKLLNGDEEGSVEDGKKALELKPEDAADVSGQFNNDENKPINILGI